MAYRKNPDGSVTVGRAKEAVKALEVAKVQAEKPEPKPKKPTTKKK